jgi:3-oxoacyl-[acyl-carrier protein] reductase
MNLGLEGKVALITGSWRGTGAAIARRLGAEGATVLVHGPELDQCEATVAEIASSGGRALAVGGDPGTDEGARALVEQVACQGPCDILVNNLGGVVEGKWFSESLEPWQEAWNGNVLGGIRLIHGLVPGMRDRGWGRVVLVATIGATRPAARTPHYYAAKAALPNIALSLAKELAGSGVTVNTVSPGLLRTAEVEAWLRGRAERKGLGDLPWEEIEKRALADVAPNLCGRLGLPEDVASTVAWLVSQPAGFLNALHVRVDGGGSDHVH